MLALFSKMEGVVTDNFTPKDKTVNSENYCNVLRKKLKPAIRMKLYIKL
jgi:hypothetical protein